MGSPGCFFSWGGIDESRVGEVGLYRMPNGYAGFPGGSAGKEFTCNVGDPGSIPGLGRSPGEEKGYPLQYSDLENSVDCISMGSQRVGHN